MPFKQINIPEIKNLFPEITTDPPSTATSYWKINHTPYEFRLASHYEKIVQDNPIGRQVVQELSKDNQLRELVSKNISWGDGHGGFEIKTMAMWFIWYANKFGNDRTVERLNGFLSAQKISVIRTLWVLGIQIESEIVLDNGYIIRSIDNMPDSSEKEEFLQKCIGRNPDIIKTPMCAITRCCNVNKIADDPIQIPDEYWATGICLEQIAWLLNALDYVSCMPYCSTADWANDTPLGPFKGVIAKTSHNYDIVGSGILKLGNDIGIELNNIVTSYYKLPESERFRFGIILRRLSQAKREQQIEDKILDLSITLEIMLLDRKISTGEITATFKLRGSRLLGNSEKERDEISKKLADIYEYRSQVVHSGFLKDPNKVNKAFTIYQSLTEKICRHLLINGKPDWDKIIS